MVDDDVEVYIDLADLIDDDLNFFAGETRERLRAFKARVLAPTPEPPRRRGWTSEQAEALRQSQLAVAFRMKRKTYSGSWRDLYRG